MYMFRHTSQKMKFPIKGFFSKCDQIRSFLQIWSHLPEKSLIETSFFVQCQLQRMKEKKKKFLVLDMIAVFEIVKQLPRQRCSL